MNLKSIFKALKGIIPNREKRKKKFFKESKKLLPLKDHYIPGVTEKMTHSEEMQDKLEPILCPMHEDYDDVEKAKK